MNRSSIKAAPKLSVENSSFLDSQFGVVTQKVFRAGEIIFTVVGPVVPKRTIYTFPLDFHNHIDPATKTGEPTLGHFLNHSCYPNAYARIVKQSIGGYVEIVARQKIKAGEEVVIDYALMEYEVAAKMTTCQCGANDCRKYIVGYKDLPQSQKEKYQAEGLVAGYLLELDKAQLLTSLSPSTG